MRKFLIPIVLSIIVTGCSSQPTWQVIGENLDNYVDCKDIELDGEGVPSRGYGPCVKLSDVSYDRKSGDEYCYNATPLIGGYEGQYYGDISNWQAIGSDYYCVSWTARYAPSDPNEPSDWRIEFSNNDPSSLLR